MFEYIALGPDGETLGKRQGFSSWLQAMFGAWRDGWTGTNCDHVEVGKVLTH